MGHLILFDQVHISIMIEFYSSFLQNPSHLFNLLLCRRPIPNVHGVSDTGEIRLVVTRPGLRCEDDVLELRSIWQLRLLAGFLSLPREYELTYTAAILQVK